MNYLRDTIHNIKHIIVIPIIWTLIIPLVIFDVWVEIYHRSCFPLCKIPFIKRSRYIRIDRHRLKYLTFFQKIYCMYCGYAIGLINYWKEIGSQTEKYWCGIKHKKSADFEEPEHHTRLEFSEYNDEGDFKSKYVKK